MATPSFYHPALTPSCDIVQLSTNEASHASKSRRLGLGQAVNLLNGKGLVGQGHIAELENRSVSVKLSSITLQPRRQSISIATAIPKGDRQKVMVDMLTQLGVSEIIPLTCEHSITRFKPNMHDKWRRLAVESCKQSQNPWLPEIDEAISVADLVKVAKQRLVFADAEGNQLREQANEVEKLIVMIGPEGGFSLAETQLFHDNGIKSVTLACHILRTETAAICAAAQCG